VLGAAVALPWVDGVVYLGRDDAAPELLLPPRSRRASRPACWPWRSAAWCPSGPIAVLAAPPQLVPCGVARARCAGRSRTRRATSRARRDAGSRRRAGPWSRSASRSARCSPRPRPPAIDHAPAFGLEIRGDLVVVAQFARSGVTMTVASPHARRRIARLQLDGAFAVRMRLGEAWTLTVADDRGRVIVVDLLRAALRRDLRIS
jgi:hypothetical protein